MTGIIVTGRTGQVGGELIAALAPLGRVLALDRAHLDLTNPQSIRAVIRAEQPEIIVNAAAYNAVDDAEAQRDLAMQVNGVAPGIMAEEARRLGALLIHYSTNHVFDGDLGRPHEEEDAPRPLNAYGASKLAGERAVQAAGGAYLILRTSWIYGDHGTNFVSTILRLAREKPELAVVADQSGSPTWARALASATADLLRRKDLIAGSSGIYHLAAAGATSRYELAKTIVTIAKEAFGMREGWASVRPVTSAEYPSRAPRPSRAILGTDKIRNVFAIEMARWEVQLRSCLEEMARSPRPSAGADGRRARSP